MTPVDYQHRNTKPQFTVFLLVDVSLAMGQYAIDALNVAIPNLIEEIKYTLSEIKIKYRLYKVNILVSILEISDTIKWMHPKRMNVTDFTWIDLRISQTYQTTRLGAAFDEINFRLSKRQLLENDAEFPIILFFSASPSSDKYCFRLDELKSNPWFRNAIKFAIPLKRDTVPGVLTEFVDSPDFLLGPSDLMRSIRSILEHHIYHHST